MDARQTLFRSATVVALLLCTAACSSAPPTASSASARPSTPSPSALPQLPQGCEQQTPCTFKAGRYRLGTGTVLERLVLTLPEAGWTSTENHPGELDLYPPGKTDEHLLLWVDMVAVQSTGKGHGLTTLTDVGRSPAALLAWLDGNPDLTVRPLADRSFAGIRLQGRSVTPSATARYDDAGCPSNPRCADLFTQGRYETEDVYAIGYPGIAGIWIGGPIAGHRTVLLVLDAADPQGLTDLEHRVQSVVDSMTLS